MFLQIAVVVLGLRALFILFERIRTKPLRLREQHVIVTGASEGLGLSICEYLVAQGAKVSLISRSEAKLNAALEKISREHDCEGRVAVFPGDVSNFESINAAVQRAIAKFGTPEIVIPCAGLSKPGYFHQQDPEVFKSVIDVNYLGSVYTVKAALPSMIERKQGRIVFVSSMLGLMSCVGYAQYCPSKYALRGLAESLRNELVMFNIGVHIFYPSNIDTPGFVVENLTKPPVTVKLEGRIDTVKPEYCAKKMFQGLAKNQFQITSDFLAEVCRIGTNSIAPRNYWLTELLVVPLVVLMQGIFRLNFDWVVRKEARVN